jgi:phosphoribosylformimino-5-aminoimidazole carboxamide ribotide isomerase
MEVIPAIDLRDGKCVRLIQGQYDRQITYKDDPVAQAKEFLNDGANFLHIVDLDGARIGQSINRQAIADINSNVNLKVELGGGIRTEQDIEETLALGVTRIIIGTAAVNNFPWFEKMTHKFPEKLILGLDAKGTKAATDGWTHETHQRIADLAIQASNLPIAAIIYTDITKDGMLAGPNIERTAELVNAVNTDIIAAGGVTTIEDIKKLKKTGVAAAIMGRALYEGTTKLKDAIAAAKE